MSTDLRQGIPVATIAKKRGRRKLAHEWVWVVQERLRDLACDRRLKGSHWRVLAYVLSCATFAQEVQLRQRDLAEALGMHASNVTRMLRDLARLGVITRVETHRYPPTYRLNSGYIYKGQHELLEQRRAYQGKADAQLR